MSLSKQPPAPLAEYSQLCKSPNPDGFSDAFARTGAPKEFGGAAFEWQRTEGKLSAIGLPVVRQEGLGKNPGFTDEDKLCFFEGKPEQDQRETEAPSKPCQPASGHLETWTPAVAEKSRSAESLGVLGLAGWQTEPAGCPRGSPIPAPKRGITDQEKAGGPKSGEADGRGDAEIPDDPPPCPKAPEIPGWNPTFGPLLSEVAGLKNGSPGDIFQDGSRLSAWGSSAPKVGPPTTTVELAQDDGKGGGAFFSETEDARFLSELEEKPDTAATTASGFLSRGGAQRKAMRRAMSECSHLSVPPALHLADKYPELVTVAERESPQSVLSPSVGAPSRKPSGPMKRSATLSDEQASARRLGPDSAAPLCPVVKEEEEKKDDDDGGVPLKRELGSPGSFPSKLALIPENGKKGERGGSAAQETEDAQFSGAIPAVEAGRGSPRLGPEASSGVLAAPSARPGGGEKPEDSRLLAVVAVVVVVFRHGRVSENFTSRRTIETTGWGRRGGAC